MSIAAALPTAAHLIQADLHLTEEQLGLLFSAFFWTYSLVQIPVGWLAERYGGPSHSAPRSCHLGVRYHLRRRGALFPYPAGAAIAARHRRERRVSMRVHNCSAATVPIKHLGTANGTVAFAYLSRSGGGTFVGGMLMAHYGWRAAFVGIRRAVAAVASCRGREVKLPRRAVRRSDGDKPTFATILKQPSLWGTVLGPVFQQLHVLFHADVAAVYLVHERVSPPATWPSLRAWPMWSMH